MIDRHLYVNRMYRSRAFCQPTEPTGAWSWGQIYDYTPAEKGTSVTERGEKLKSWYYRIPVNVMRCGTRMTR